MNVCCGGQYQPSPTFSVRGRLSCRVRTQGPVTQSGPCRRQYLSTTHEAMTSGSGPQRRTSFPKFQGAAAEQDRAQQLATLSVRMGGLGLRSAARCARAAYWASWADALPMREKRNPAIAEMVEHTLANGAHSEHGCLSEQLVRIAQGQAPSGEPVEGTWRVATWLAELVFFRRRHLFQEEFHAVRPNCRELGTPSFPFRSQRWGRVGLRSHSS